ncbi:hypothetical protein [Oricola sp.]|uniref:hypothetical protein n=1 Tax=Oricola sp. TaxID=1979950 RepID=UPI0025FCDC47|nr:hypothetical protein [Oricola sp.]MCI5073515.1 hypothetical protein [Oricola sp.]
MQADMPRRAGSSRRGGAPPILVEDEETVARFREFGRQGLGKTGIARVLGVHRHTPASFLDRAHRAGTAYEEGLQEWRAADRLARQAAPRAARNASAALKTGGTCPTCGGLIGEGDAHVTLTPADIAEAQRTLDELIDRHLAAGGAGGDPRR